MDKKNELMQTVERQDSIKVSRNAKGQHSFEIKKYYDGDRVPAEHVVTALKALEDNLLEVFKDSDE